MQHIDRDGHRVLSRDVETGESVVQIINRETGEQQATRMVPPPQRPSTCLAPTHPPAPVPPYAYNGASPRLLLILTSMICPSVVVALLFLLEKSGIIKIRLCSFLLHLSITESLLYLLDLYYLCTPSLVVTLLLPFYGHGNMKMLRVLQKHLRLVEVATIFLQPDATHEEIAAAGNKLLVALYGGGVTSTLYTRRYEIFVRSAANSKVHLARLPPTEEAAAQHAYRTYHQG